MKKNYKKKEITAKKVTITLKLTNHLDKNCFWKITSIISETNSQITTIIIGDKKKLKTELKLKIKFSIGIDKYKKLLVLTSIHLCHCIPDKKEMISKP